MEKRVVPSKSRLRRLHIQRQAKFKDDNLLRIIIKINNRTIYNIQAVRTNFYTDTGNVGEYNVEETVSGFTFKLKNFKRELGALVLTKLLVEKIIKKEN